MSNHTLSKREYNTVHQWMLRHYKKTGRCDFCKELKKTEWSNKSGNYNKNIINDWHELCRQCHIKYDKEVLGLNMGGRKKGARTWLSENPEKAKEIGRLGAIKRWQQ